MLGAKGNFVKKYRSQVSLGTALVVAMALTLIGGLSALVLAADPTSSTSPSAVASPGPASAVTGTPGSAARGVDWNALAPLDELAKLTGLALGPGVSTEDRYDEIYGEITDACTPKSLECRWLTDGGASGVYLTIRYDATGTECEVESFGRPPWWCPIVQARPAPTYDEFASTGVPVAGLGKEAVLLPAPGYPVGGKKPVYGGIVFRKDGVFAILGMQVDPGAKGAKKLLAGSKSTLTKMAGLLDARWADAVPAGLFQPVVTPDELEAIFGMPLIAPYGDCRLPIIAECQFTDETATVNLSIGCDDAWSQLTHGPIEIEAIEGIGREAEFWTSYNQPALVDLSGQYTLWWDNGELDGPGIVERCTISVFAPEPTADTTASRREQLVALATLVAPRVAARN